MAEIKIVGVKKGTTKKGAECFNYYGVKNFTDYDQQNSFCMGQTVVSEFSYTDYGVEVGDIVDFRYEPGFEGKATLVDIVMLRPAGNVPSDQKQEKDKKEAGGKQ